MELLDCTLRDGANVVANGFDAERTKMIIEGLIESNITLIEMGNCLGIGAYDANSSVSPLTDSEYCDLAVPYLNRARIGMFAGYRNVTAETVKLAADKGLHFLRIGANAGDGALAREAIARVKGAGIRCFYSIMKGYIQTPEELANEALMLAETGVDLISIMDSAGTMLPTEINEYVTAVVNAVNVPVGFHAHNNLGLSVANSLAAISAGAATIDTSLMGMGRSAGNLPTECAVAVLWKVGRLKEIDLISLLRFIDNRLGPAVAELNHEAPVKPIDIVYGYAGCHSSFAAEFDATSKKTGVDLYRLIIEVSKVDQKSPSVDLINRVADRMKNEQLRGET